MVSELTGNTHASPQRARYGASFVSSEEYDREVSGVRCIMCSCIIAITVHLQLYNSMFSKAMFMVLGRIM